MVRGHILSGRVFPRCPPPSSKGPSLTQYAIWGKKPYQPAKVVCSWSCPDHSLQVTWACLLPRGPVFQWGQRSGLAD